MEKTLRLKASLTLLMQWLAGHTETLHQRQFSAIPDTRPRQVSRESDRLILLVQGQAHYRTPCSGVKA
jgi:hypothetical protein